MDKRFVKTATDGASAHPARRGEQRHQEFLLGAFVVAAVTDHPARPCVVHDLSATGARLELERTREMKSPTTSDLPDSVTLYLCPTRTEIDCRVAWRDGRHMGVEFVSKERPASHGPAGMV